MQKLSIDLCMSNTGKETLSGFSLFDSLCIDEYDWGIQWVTCTRNGEEGCQVVVLESWSGSGWRVERLAHRNLFFNGSMQRIFWLAQPLSVVLVSQLCVF